MKLPLGFEVAGITAGLKHSGRRDLGLILGENELTWALVSTTNKVFAPCVGRNRARLTSGDSMRALIINSGNANCANGEQGWHDNEQMASAAAEALNLMADDVLTASTGVVGQRMPLEKIEAALPDLTAALDDDSAAFAAAIMTTDTTLKQVEVTLPGGARVVGVAKGSGMIHPNMATMLAFVLTDAKLSQDKLRSMWRFVTERTFNQITVDGDTSPNDMAFVFTSGLTEADPADLQSALLEVAQTLARKVARDGEGASKLITVSVSGARNDEEARAAARTVASSPLVKAAVHGNDPNWGRILVALGRSGASFDQANVSIALQGATVYDGVPHPYDEAAVSDLLKQEEVLITASLGDAGNGNGTAWGCDLTAEYVRINADYTT